jgi:hypothetical protein
MEQWKLFYVPLRMMSYEKENPYPAIKNGAKRLGLSKSNYTFQLPKGTIKKLDRPKWINGRCETRKQPFKQ